MHGEEEIEKLLQTRFSLSLKLDCFLDSKLEKGAKADGKIALFDDWRVFGA